MSSTDQIPAEAQELIDAIAAMPDVYEQVKGPLTRLVGSLNRKRRILELVQGALGQLRLDMKYLLFDLEATRRERDEYKAQLEK